MNKLLVVLILFLLLNSCDYSRYRYSFFEGNWVLINYLDTVQKYRSVAKAGHMRMQEIILQRHVDSACFLFDGWERHVFAYENKTSNNIHIPGYLNQKKLDLFINEYAYYLSYDSEGTRYVFVKPEQLLVDSQANESWPVSTQRVINSLVLGGIYKLGNSLVPVQFYTDGAITGLPGYDYYEVCTGGECRSFYEGDLVYLSGSQAAVYCTWEWKEKKMTLFLLKKVNAPGEPLRFVKGEPLFSFVKLK